MSAALPNQDNFAERLKRVGEEVQNRIATKPEDNLYAQRARLWGRWIIQNVLTPPPVKRKPINCDLYPWRTKARLKQGR